MGRFKKHTRSIKRGVRRFVKRGGFSTAYDGTKLSSAIARNDYNEAHRTIIGDGTFAANMDKAYRSNRKSGYSIGTYKGETVLFVAGTRYKGHWLSSLANLVTPEWIEFKSNAKARELDRVAKRAGVKTAVGHSRGAYLVAKMKAPVAKMGVDGAAILDKRDRGVMMLNQRQPFDAFLGRQNKDFRDKAYKNYLAARAGKWKKIRHIKSAKNVHYYADRHFLRWPGRRFHRIYRDFD